jgi:hypothetical protein
VASLVHHALTMMVTGWKRGNPMSNKTTVDPNLNFLVLLQNTSKRNLLVVSRDKVTKKLSNPMSTCRNVFDYFAGTLSQMF